MRRVAPLSAVVLSLAAASSATAAETLSATDRLPDRRYTATGDRAYVVGSEDGRFPAMGFHTRGEMAGVWAPPIKLLDGLWFGIDGEWVGPAAKFTSGYGHVKLDLPATKGVQIERTDFAPDGRRGVLVGLRLTSPDADRTVELSVNAHSELMGVYPWGESTPSQLQFNLRDQASFTGGRLEFSETGTPPVPNAGAHDWAAVVGSALDPSGGRAGDAFRGPQDPPVYCPASGPGTPEQPKRCDDTEYGRGKGAGGELRYRVELEQGEARELWLGVAGSDAGVGSARRELDALLDDPAQALEDKIAGREDLAGYTRLSLPGDPLLADGIDWSKQNLADSVQDVRDLDLREVNAGKAYPPPKGTLDRARFLGAGWPDYPWLFGTDGEYTAFASVAVGQFEPIKDHLRALRDASRVINGSSGKVVHEVVTDGSVYFGSNADPGNTDETAKFPSAVALLWRWTGDDAFLDEMYAFSVANLRYIFRELDDDGDGWPEGLGNVEREGMGEEKLDNTVYTIRGLWDLVDLAEARGDRATERWARTRARDLTDRFEAAWWMPEVPQHADSLDDPGNVRKQQRHWIGATPMEAELVRNGRTVPGLTTLGHATAALALRETRCYSSDNGMFHTGEAGCDPVVSDRPSELDIFTLNSAIIAVGEGNYGRLAEQKRYTTANRKLQLPVADEQPGAMPERATAPAYGANIDKLFTERGMVLQAWGAYGTAWPVVHQQLGVRPDLGRGEIEVVPQLPPGQPRIAGRDIRLGDDGAIDVIASAGDGAYRTAVTADAPVRMRLGHTLPRDADVARVELGGRRVRDYSARRTHRGLEVTVDAAPGEPQELEITTR